MTIVSIKICVKNVLNIKVIKVKTRKREKLLLNVCFGIMMVPKFKITVRLERMLIFLLPNINCYLTSNKQDK